MPADEMEGGQACCEVGCGQQMACREMVAATTLGLARQSRLAENHTAFSNSTGRCEGLQVA